MFALVLCHKKLNSLLSSQVGEGCEWALCSPVAPPLSSSCGSGGLALEALRRRLEQVVYFDKERMSPHVTYNVEMCGCVHTRAHTCVHTCTHSAWLRQWPSLALQVIYVVLLLIPLYKVRPRCAGLPCWLVPGDQPPRGPQPPETHAPTFLPREGKPSRK